MTPRWERIAVLGLGLLGGSVALAARRRGLASRVVGAGRRQAPLDAALERGVVDAVTRDPAEAVRGADLVVLASPVPAMPSLIEQASAGLAPGAVVTDVGSVKAVLCETLPGLLPEGVHYVGAHPMAGSHLRGVEHARDDLFEHSVCAVTPLPDSETAAVERVSAFWRALGARVVMRAPQAHDLEVAWTSHVPHALAFAFAQALAGAPADVGELAGGGFRDFTRIALSDGELWGDILTANRKALAAPLQAFAESLQSLARAIEEGDGDAQERFLASARETLAAVTARGARADSEARSGGSNPEIKAAPDAGCDSRRTSNHS